MSLERKHFSFFLSPKSPSHLPIDPNYINKLKEDIRRGNYPRELKLPFELTKVDYFFDHKKIINSHRPYGIHRSVALTQYQEFVKQYYLAYVNYLEAINGDLNALAKCKPNMTALLHAADIHNTEYLSENVKHSSFSLALTAFLFLDVFYCRDLSAAARLKAVECLAPLIDTEKDKDKYIQAFLKYIKGYELNSASEEPVFDLLPVDFFPQEADVNVKSHNQLFMDNEFIKLFFPTKDIEATLEAILVRHPREAAQIFRSLLRLNSWEVKIDKAAVAAKIISLAALPSALHEKVFGREASFMPRESNPYVLEHFAKVTLGEVEIEAGLTDSLAAMSELDLKKMALQFLLFRGTHGKNGSNGYTMEKVDEAHDIHGNGNSHHFGRGLRNHT